MSYVLVKTGVEGIEGVLYVDSDKSKVEAVRDELQVLIDSYVAVIEPFNDAIDELGDWGSDEYESVLRKKREAEESWLEAHGFAFASWFPGDVGNSLEIIEPRNNIFIKRGDL